MKYTQEYFYQRYIVDGLSVKQISQETQLTKRSNQGQIKEIWYT